MPDFANAQIACGPDLRAYEQFLVALAVRQVVTLPLEDGERSRVVMRALNAAAERVGVRLYRLHREGERAVRFRVLSAKKRRVRVSPEARRVIVEKARATRLARGSIRARERHQPHNREVLR
jgi:hypothetical protein